MKEGLRMLAYLETEPCFRRIQGHCYLWILAHAPARTEQQVYRQTKAV